MTVADLLERVGFAGCPGFNVLGLVVKLGSKVLELLESEGRGRGGRGGKQRYRWREE